MANLLEGIRNAIQTSIYGRRLGLTNDFLAGVRGVIEPVEDLSTTAGTSAAPYGVTMVLTSGSSQVSLNSLQAPPSAGIRKVLRLQSTSTGTAQFQLSGPSIVVGASLTTLGATVISLVKQNATASLLSLSTSVWALMNPASSLPSSEGPGISFSTST
jgi:outer membrane receptor protein involved in Fe transport